jgi:hypothetical protein
MATTEKPTEQFSSEHVEQDRELQTTLAQVANQDEHDLGKIESIRKFPLAFIWSCYAVWCVLLVSFENQAAGNIIGVPKFRQDFGHPYNGDYVIPANWQSAFQGAPVAS